MRRAVLEHAQVTLELANLRPASRQRQWGRTAAVTLIALTVARSCANACGSGPYTPMRGCGASDARGAILPPCRWSTAFVVARYRRVAAVAAGYRAGRGATSYNPHSF